MATEDLKDEILELKKRLHTIASENYLLKVKVRKLNNELDKKDKQIECLLDPSKTTCIRKIISERGATMIINLKQRNNELEEALIAKDNVIKKLHLDIQTSKVYSPKESTSTHIKNFEHKRVPLKYRECNHGSPKINTKLRSRSLTVTPVPQQSYLKSSSDIQMECVRLAQNLQKIKLANSVSKQRPSSYNVVTEKTKSTVENVLAKSFVEKSNTSTCNGTQNVQKYFTNLVDEMEKLKTTVTHLSTEQENTKKFLKDKKNIEILARKVKHLQKSKFTKTSPYKSQNNVNLKPLDKFRCDEQGTSTSFSYSLESFEDKSSNGDSPEKSSTANCNERIGNTESQIEISENIEIISDDDDVETGDSK